MNNTSHSNVYEIVTQKIIEALKNGVVPWNQPWKKNGAPRNFLSNKEYRGMNHFLLRLSERGTAYWLTRAQIELRGGTIRDGEKGSIITFWKSPDKERDGEQARPILRCYRVWNHDQCDGLPPCPADEPGAQLEPKAAAEAIVKNMPLAPKISKSGDEAYYSIIEDRVNIPTMKKFKSVDGYYSTLFHELTHSTRHSSRLNRTARNEKPDQPRKFGSCDYSREELVAEMAAAFLCAEAGITNTAEQSASYCDSWLAAVSDDDKLLVHAAAAAQKAADFILGREQPEPAGIPKTGLAQQPGIPIGIRVEAESSV